MRYCTNCGNKAPEKAQHCPNCGKPLAAKKSSPVPFYLAGVAVLVIGGILMGNLLKNRTPANPPIPSDVPGIAGETPDQQATGSDHTQAVSTATPVQPTSSPTAASSPTPPLPSEKPIGKIVFTCQLFRDNTRNQICLMNGDGTDYRRLTTDDNSNHFYASLAPDGKSVVFSSNQSGKDEIYEMDLDGSQTRLTFLGEVYAPEISPNGKHIVFTNSGGLYSAIWIMERDGSNPHLLFGQDGVEALDPTWSPDGQRVLFAMGIDESKKLHTVNANGKDLTIVSDQFNTRGRSDWSPDGTKIAGYTGERWQREIYLMNFDGSSLLALFTEGNVQAPSFSPDGGWVGFTGYIHNMRNDDGCEIYTMRLKDGELQRLTNNNYCDWQPRWGP